MALRLGVGLAHTVLHLPQSALADKRVKECRQHTDLDAGQSVQKAESQEIQLQETQNRAHEQPGKPGPFALLPAVLSTQIGLAEPFLQVVIV